MVVANSVVKLGILNSALVRLGESTVTSFEESGAATVLYDQVRLAMLESFHWPFASYRKRLAKMAVSPPSDFSNMFALPGTPAFVKAIDIELTTPNAPYQLESFYEDATATTTQVLVTDAADVVLNYVGETDEAIWSPLLRFAFGKHLALELSTSITGKARLRQNLIVEAEAALRKAITSAQTQDTPKRMETDDRYVLARVRDAGFRPDFRGPVDIEELIV